MEDICSEQAIPLSMGYKRAKKLVDQGMMIIERRVVTDEGKRYAIYRTSFSLVSVRMKNGVVSAEVTVNPDLATNLKEHPLARRWRGELADEILSPTRGTRHGVD